MGFKRIYLYLLIGIITLFFGISGTFSQNDTSRRLSPGLKIDSSLLSHKKKFSLSAGMGISYGSAPSLTTFLQETLPLSKDSVKTFNVGIEFFGGLEYEISPKFSLRLEYTYFIRSITYTYSYFTFDYFINMHQPYLMANYLIEKKSYEFKLGAGAGYILANFENNQSQSNPVKYTSGGLGLKGEFVFAAYLSPSFHSYISVFVAGSMLGPLKDSGGNNLKSPLTNSDVKLGGVGGGIRLGFSILF